MRLKRLLRVRTPRHEREWPSWHRRTLTLTPLALVPWVLASASWGGPGHEQPEPRFQAYPTCDVFSREFESARSCEVASDWGGVFVLDTRSPRRYVICLRRPDRSRDCYRRRSGGYSQPIADGFFHQPASRQAGRYRLTWRMDGVVLDRDKLLLTRSKRRG